MLFFKFAQDFCTFVTTFVVESFPLFRQFIWLKKKSSLIFWCIRGYILWVHLNQINLVIKTLKKNKTSQRSLDESSAVSTQLDPTVSVSCKPCIEFLTRMIGVSWLWYLLALRAIFLFRYLLTRCHLLSTLRDGNSSLVKIQILSG